ncbi:MAG: mechanosensitive ion channel [candidate division Zixibacteria bacterium]|nr:mechanosensitive ion channel [candidate division Zixibacteria bacterium]
MEPQLTLTNIVAWAATTGFHIGIIIVFSVAAIILARVLFKNFRARINARAIDRENKKRAKTLNTLFHYITNMTIVIVGVIMILSELGIKIGPILAAAGFAGLAVGFGAQRLIQDVFSGFFILMEDQIREGDYVEIAGKMGQVEKVNLRMTTLRDISGKVHFIRNGQIDIVTNLTHDYSCYLFDISVAYKEDVDEVIKIIKQVDEEMRADAFWGDDILEPIKIFGLDKFTESAVVIRARTKTRPVKQWQIGREFNRRIKKAFDENKIEIPFPHLRLYMSKGEDGKIAPLTIDPIGPDSTENENPRN